MNKQLQKLADQAELYVDLYGRPWPRAMSAEEADAAYKKFAELIVRECADICNKIYFDRYPDAEDFESSEEGDAIRKHFGVE